MGRVIDVYSDSAHVMLITDPRSEISAITQRTRYDGVIRGAGTGFLDMVYLSPKADITAGDVVITSGFGTIFPVGLQIGEVISVSSGKFEFQKKALIEPVISIKKKEEILVMKGKKTKG